MPTSKFTVYFHDFHPSEATKEYIERIIGDIQNELPGGATAKATFSLRDDVVKGMLQVTSYYGPFFSSETGEDLQKVTLKLVEQVRRRLKKFKSKRRTHDGLKQNLKRHVYNSSAYLPEDYKSEDFQAEVGA
jgi:ribosome-associated translation inhibitor RaiA